MYGVSNRGTSNWGHSKYRCRECKCYGPQTSMKLGIKTIVSSGLWHKSSRYPKLHSHITNIYGVEIHIFSLLDIDSYGDKK